MVQQQSCSSLHYMKCAVLLSSCTACLPSHPPPSPAHSLVYFSAAKPPAATPLRPPALPLCPNTPVVADTSVVAFLVHPCYLSKPICPPACLLSLQANVRNYYMQFTDMHGNALGGPPGAMGAPGVDPRQPDLAHLRANQERDRMRREGRGGPPPPFMGGPGPMGGPPRGEACWCCVCVLLFCLIDYV